MWTQLFSPPGIHSLRIPAGRQKPEGLWWHATIFLPLGYLVRNYFSSLPYNFLFFSCYALITLRNGKLESHSCSNLLGFLKTAPWDPQRSSVVWLMDSSISQADILPCFLESFWNARNNSWALWQNLILTRRQHR